MKKHLTNTIQILCMTLCILGYPSVARADCSSTLTQCSNQTDCESEKGFWVNESCSSTPPTVTCSSSALNQCTTPTDCEGVKGFWVNGQCSSSTPALTLPKLEKVFGIDGNGKSVDVSGAVFAGGISSDSGKSFMDAIQTPVELKKGGSIQIKGEITPDSSHSGKSAEIIVVGLHTSDINDTSCDLVIGKHTYYMMVDATPTSEIYCEWKEGGECKDDNNLPRVKSKNSADSYYTEWTRWDTTLANLKPSRTVPSIDKLEETLYVDNNLSYTGFICVNFGYRLDDKTLIFNAEPLKFRVSE